MSHPDVQITESCGNNEGSRKRKRKRTADYRKKILQSIECALRRVPCPIGHLFTSVDDCGTPQARLSEVCRVLGVYDVFAHAPTWVIGSLTQMTHMFAVEQEENDNWYIKFRPSTFNPLSCMVYLDKLPDSVNRERLLREAKKHGTVVQIRIPVRKHKDHPSPLFCARPRGFAFVQFTEPEAVDHICQAYSHNAPRAYTRMHLNRFVFSKEKKLQRKAQAANGHRNSLDVSVGTSVVSADRSVSDECMLSPTTADHVDHHNATNSVTGITGTEERPKFATPQRKGRHGINDSATQSISADTVVLERPTSIEGRSDRPRKPGTGTRSRQNSCTSPVKQKLSLKERRRTNSRSKFPEVSKSEQPAVRHGRKRHKKSRRKFAHLDPGFVQGSVKSHFSKMQAFPYRMYRSLREDYLKQMTTARKQAQALGMYKSVKVQQQRRDRFWTTSGEDVSPKRRPRESKKQRREKARAANMPQPQKCWIADQ